MTELSRLSDEQLTKEMTLLECNAEGFCRAPSMTNAECIDILANYIVKLETRLAILESWQRYMMENGLCKK